jgi:hypothetical protein
MKKSFTFGVVLLIMCTLLAAFAFARFSFYNKLMTEQLHTVTIESDSSGVTSDTKDVTFPATFNNAPIVMIVPPLGVDGTWSADSITITGCDVVVDTCPDMAGKSFEVAVFAHERL